MPFSPAAGSADSRGAKVVVDGVEQPFEFGGDFVRYNTSSHQANRQFVFSPDGKHVLYLASIGRVGSPTRAPRR